MERARPFVLIVWLTLTILTIGWEIVGAWHSGDRWPSITQMVTETARQYWWVRDLLFLFVIWLFWHFFDHIILPDYRQ